MTNLDGWNAFDTPLTDPPEKQVDVSKLVLNHNKKKSKGGGFQCMGLSKPVLRGVLQKGYKIPTPIQRKVIPMIFDGKDVVAMARTGSGKTAAFLIPLFEKLKMHSTNAGARALILSPTRELAIQTLSFTKELGKFTNLRAATILGGESMEDQFAAMHNFPDIIIATPGRFTHICMEMNLQLHFIQYIVFDEADLLFEMGFKEQLDNIITRLPQNRQTVLVSATLPKILIDFARAGLDDPILIRLNLETKISKKLKLGFFKINNEDKVPLLLHLIRNVILPSEMTIIFVPTKHHVEYIHKIFDMQNINSTFIYSSLDSALRKINIAKFRSRMTPIMIVTDLAARGIDIPFLDNVINFNFPPKVKLFVHRVGRVARGVRSGTAYSFVAPDEVCYLLDLHMFLSNRPVRFSSSLSEAQNEEEETDQDCVYGQVPQAIIDDGNDSIDKLLQVSEELKTLKNSAINAMKLYFRTRSSASAESIRRVKKELWGEDISFHPLFKVAKIPLVENQRLQLLDTLKNVRPKSTIFEIRDNKKQAGSLTRQEMAITLKRQLDQDKIDRFHLSMKKSKIDAQEKRNKEIKARKNEASIEPTESDLVSAFGIEPKPKFDPNHIASLPLSTWKENSSKDFIPFAPQDQISEQFYSLNPQAQKFPENATLDLMNDDAQNRKPKEQNSMKWDRKRMKFVGQQTPKKVKTESGVWVSSTYCTKKYDKWKLKMKKNNNKSTENEKDINFSLLNTDWRNKKGKQGHTFVTLADEGVKRAPLPPAHKANVKANSHNQKRSSMLVRSYNERLKYTKEQEEAKSKARICKEKSKVRKKKVIKDSKRKKSARRKGTIDA